MPTAITTCIVCSTEASVVQFGATELCICPTCGLGWLHPMPTNQERAEHYAKQYGLQNDILGNSIQAQMRRWSRLPEQLSLIADIQTLKPAPASVLDVGCDMGNFLDEIRRYGYSVAGVEPSESARSQAHQIGLQVFSSIKELCDDTNTLYDVVTMHHVLEHVDNPVVTLTELHSLMAPGGLLLLRVPDFSCFWSKLFKEKWIWFQPENHSYHFTLRSLLQVVQKAGFEIRKATSQRPNNYRTMKAQMLSSHSFSHSMNVTQTFKRAVSPYYQFVTGVELYILAQKTS